MTKDERRRQDKAIQRYIEERAKRLAMNMPMPESVDELAGMLAGYALAIQKDMTAGFIRAYIESLPCLCVAGQTNHPDCPKHGDI